MTYRKNKNPLFAIFVVVALLIILAMFGTKILKNFNFQLGTTPRQTESTTSSTPQTNVSGNIESKSGTVVSLRGSDLTIKQTDGKEATYVLDKDVLVVSEKKTLAQKEIISSVSGKKETVPDPLPAVTKFVRDIKPGLEVILSVKNENNKQSITIVNIREP